MVIDTAEVGSPVSPPVAGAGVWAGAVTGPCVQPAQNRMAMMRMLKKANERRFNVMSHTLDTYADKRRSLHPLAYDGRKGEITGIAPDKET